LCEESPQKYLESRVRIAGNWRERTLVLAMRIVMGSGEKWLFWNFVGCFFFIWQRGMLQRIFATGVRVEYSIC
jgi:hypothetical protein